MEDITECRTQRTSQFLTTEHFTLQGARNGVISEANGRLGHYLSMVESGLVRARATRWGASRELSGSRVAPEEYAMPFPSVIDMMRQLIIFRTVNPPGDELPAQEYLGTLLEEGDPMAIRAGRV